MNARLWKYLPNSDGSLCPGLDLNQGSGGEYIYMYMEKGKGKEVTHPIRDIIFIVANYNSPSWPGYYVHPIDLNRGAKGKYIWLAWTY